MGMYARTVPNKPMASCGSVDFSVHKITWRIVYHYREAVMRNLLMVTAGAVSYSPFPSSQNLGRRVGLKPATHSTHLYRTIGPFRLRSEMTFSIKVPKASWTLFLSISTHSVCNKGGARDQVVIAGRVLVANSITGSQLDHSSMFRGRLGSGGR